jgi:hypothetical protein
MSVQRWRWSVIGIWVTLACIALFTTGITARTMSVFLAGGIVPPAMLLWLWNEDRPLQLGGLSPRKRL